VEREEEVELSFRGVCEEEFVRLVDSVSDGIARTN
jgi:hypothetical protein